MRHKDCDFDERGSLAPLGIGLAIVSLTLVIVVLISGSLYLTERRLTTLAESTALAVLADSGDFQELSQLAGAFLSEAQNPGLQGVHLIEASKPDSLTVRVRICSDWASPFPNYMFSDRGRVCSEGLARRGR